MTETISIEAVRAAGGSQSPATVNPAGPGGSQFIAAGPNAADAMNRVPPAEAVQRFEAAMAATPIPFATEVGAAWRTAQVNNQGILHRIRALSELKETHSPAAANLVELQYEVMNLAFQQEVVTKVADKASTAIQTLVKNQ